MRRFLPALCAALLALVCSVSFAQISGTTGPFGSLGASVSIAGGSSSSSASTALPGVGGTSLQVYNSGTVAATIAWSQTSGGATATATSTIVGAGVTAYLAIPYNVIDVAVYGVGGTPTVYLQRGGGGVYNNPFPISTTNSFAVPSGGPTVPALSTANNSLGSANSLTFAAGTWAASASGSNQCLLTGALSSDGVGHQFGASTFALGGNGDLSFCSGVTRPFFDFQMLDNTAGRQGGIQLFASATAPTNSDNFAIYTQTPASTSCTPYTTYAGPCSAIESDTIGSYPLVLAFKTVGEIALLSNDTKIMSGATTGVRQTGLDATNDGSGNLTTTLGSTNGTSTTVIQAPAGGISFSNVTTGTNADFVCFAAGNVMTLQSSACTISSLRFKKNVHDFSGSAEGEIDKLRVAEFQMREENKDPNGNASQVGLIAEDIARVMPECAIYENDMATPKSYRQECVIAMLVKANQEQQRQINQLKRRHAH